MALYPTKWYPQSGIGYRVAQSGTYIQDNLGNTIVDNSLNYLIPNPYYLIGKYATVWSKV